MSELKPCPFCGGNVKIQIRDDEGNLKPESYKNNPWSGLSFSVQHHHSDNEKCPIATHHGEPLGVFLYSSEDELTARWNNRENQ